MKKIYLAIAAVLITAFSVFSMQVTPMVAKTKLYVKAIGEIAHAHLFNFMARQGLILGANTLTGLIPTLYEALDIVSRESVGFVPAVAKNSSGEKAALNETITIPVTPATSLIDITPGQVPASSGGQIIAPTSMTISKSKAAEVLWNGEEQRGMNNAGTYGGVLTNQFVQAFRALGNSVETDLAALATAASRGYGTPGTAPFGTASDMSDFAQTRKILIDNGAPQGDLHLVMNTTAAANLRGKQSGLFKVNEAGSAELLRTGSIALPVEGFMMHESGQIATFVKGTGASYTTNTAGYAVGSTAITLITGTGTVLAGDVVTFAGDTNKYGVAVGTAAAGVITLAEPGLRVAIPASATAMTVGASYTANVAFDRNAIQLITRAPAMPVGPDGKAIDMAEDVMELQDPVTGIVFQIAMYRLYRQIKYEIGLAWGVKALAPRHIALLLG
ncbi:MAG: P22 phage major capsid protein family protein [Herbaspirillum sp.]